MDFFTFLFLHCWSKKEKVPLSSPIKTKGFINNVFCRNRADRNPAGPRLDSPSLVNKQVAYHLTHLATSFHHLNHLTPFTTSPWTSHHCTFSSTSLVPRNQELKKKAFTKKTCMLPWCVNLCGPLRQKSLQERQPTILTMLTMAPLHHPSLLSFHPCIKSPCHPVSLTPSSSQHFIVSPYLLITLPSTFTPWTSTWRSWPTSGRPGWTGARGRGPRTG